MTFEEFRASLAKDMLPDGTPELLRALWLDGRGDWDGAHRVAQEIGTADGSRVHAYLHRKEGDLENARYWYRRAGRPECRESLDSEWQALAREFLPQP